MEDQESNDGPNDLLEYFRDVVLVTAGKLQSWTEEKMETEVSFESTCDDFGNKLLECITGMSSEEVHKVVYIIRF